MAHLFDTLKDRARKRAEYHRIAREIRDMPRDVALDLDIYPGDAKKIAYDAVYGA